MPNAMKSTFDNDLQSEKPKEQINIIKWKQIPPQRLLRGG